jgi:hypothetical protein
LVGVQRSRVVVLVAIVAAALIGPALWWWASGDGGDGGDGGDQTGQSSPTTTVSPSTDAGATSGPSTADPTTADPTTTAVSEPTGPATASASDPSTPPSLDPEQAAVIDEITAFVSDERGLPFLEDVPVEFLPEDEFVARLDETSEEDIDEEERARTEELWKALRLIGPDDDLYGLVDQAGQEGTLGFYEYDTRSMVVRGEELTPFVRVTLAHELTHALDDQHFGLDREELEDDSEAEFGFLVLTEGSAEYVASRYEAQLSADEQEELADEMASFVGGADLEDVPVELLLAIQMPYLLGPDLIEAVVDDGGIDGLDASFDDPPTTAEQAFEPQAYLDRDEAVDVPLPPAGADAVDDGVFGALGMFLLFPGATGFDLAEGWAGDSYVQWLDDDERPCVRVDLLAEGDGADDYESALSSWSDAHGDAVTERIGDTVRLTACG